MLRWQILYTRPVVSVQCRWKSDFQYLQHSKIPTLHFQKSLPRLPIPELEKTSERYLNAQRPLLSETSFKETKKLVGEFHESEGKRLHEELKRQNANNKHTSYISQPWFDMYLMDRVPLPINYNPALVFNSTLTPKGNSQVQRATNMIVSSLRFLNSLRSNKLAPEVFHLNPKKSDTGLFRNVTRFLPSSVSWYGAYMFNAYPLDMSQYSSLFNSTRVPQKARDVLVKDESGKHIVVLRKGHFFTLQVLDDSGNILPPEDIYTCLHDIGNRNLDRKDSLGYMTTENRDTWAEVRQHVVSLSKDNAEAVRAIDSALFVLCLDDGVAGEDRASVLRTFLHGDATNRWFDKSFSLILTKDGAAGVNFEHSWGDGVAVLRYFQDIHKDRGFVGDQTKLSKVSTPELITELKVTLDDRAAAAVRKAKTKFDSVCTSLAISGLEMPGFGKDDCKTAQISPDSVMQLAFQVAYHKMYGNFVATYESCSTAAFKHGRTETVRPCTNATKAFAVAMNGRDEKGNSELIQLMKECSKVHGNLTKEAAMGQGFDRHLFGLRALAAQKGGPLPGIFQDSAYQAINHNILSTSTLSSEAVALGGFGPVVKDGLGVGYSILNNFCGAVVTSYPPHRDGAGFIDALNTTLKQFSKLLASK